jgi:hypothetical protein
MLIMNHLSEDSIVAAFDYLKTHGVPGSGEIPLYPLAAMIENWPRLPPELKQPRP